MEKIFSLTSSKIDFKAKRVVINKEGFYHDQRFVSPGR